MSTLLRNARRYDGTVVDLLVEDGLLSWSSNEPQSHVSTPVDEQLDLDGRWVGPGLWDSHVHFGQWSLVSRRLDVSGARSAAETAALVRDEVAKHPPEPATVLIGQGFRDGLWPDEPTSDLLDIGDVPVALVSGDVHCMWTNAAALRLLGLPPHAWLLREKDAFDLNVRLSAVPDAQLDGWALEAAATAASRGVVGIVDLEMSGAVASWQRRFGAGFRGLRVRAGVYPDDLDAVAAAGVRTGQVVPETDGLLVGGPFKLFTDGSLNTRTAWCYDDYPGISGPDAAGLAIHPADELLGLARAAVARGFLPAIHAIGDRATTLALDTFEAIGPLPTDLARIGGSIEHAQLIAAADLPRFAALHVRASVQPEHALDDRDVADHFWAGRTGRAFVYRALWQAGAELALGSDAPVAPLDPWVTISAAVSRSRDGREPWHPEQALPIDAALRSSWGGVPDLAVGGPADLVVTERNPIGADGEQLRDMAVHATMVAGEWTHQG
ncbi:MAG TPA: amidohydrolase family protein [Pseudolysinimonas sp.]|nr:amidohydrolase family protein [Pseudolysinimonas sp.]